MPWDDFFELGGDSILALQLTHRMQSELSLKITIVDIFEAPTVELILQRDPESVQHQPVLVDMKSTASNIRLYFVHASSGEILFLKDVCSASRFNVSGLRSAGLSNAENADKKITSMANRYLSEIGTRRDKSEISILVGYSLGAAVAYQMTLSSNPLARRFDGLILIDPPSRGVKAPHQLDAYVAERFLELSKLYDLNPNRELERSALIEDFRAARAIPDFTSNEAFINAQYVWAYNMMALDSYSAGGEVDIPSVVFATLENRPIVEPWLKVLSNLRGFETFSCDHFDVMRKDNFPTRINWSVHQLISASA